MGNSEELFAVERIGSKLSVIRHRGELSVGITNMLARTGISNEVRPDEARRMGEALIRAAVEAGA